ncbi:hypothetical protein DP49_5877 [Burkholderia pseudomallei]|nr:hypothetical protein DP49_5877 [Burkholderia pseudomallei]KGS72900.1 hypothetical protein X942_5967 [Burkholderia pseudomallei MSHR5596]
MSQIYETIVPAVNNIDGLLGKVPIRFVNSSAQ